MLKKIKDKIKYMQSYGIMFSVKYIIYGKSKFFLKKNKLVEKNRKDIFE